MGDKASEAQASLLLSLCLLLSLAFLNTQIKTAAAEEINQ